MKTLIGIYSGYNQARIGLGSIFKENLADRKSANVLILEQVVVNTIKEGRGADNKEIAGDIREQGWGAGQIDIKELKPEQLSWLDHFIADHKCLSFAEIRHLCYSGNYLSQIIQQSIANGNNSILSILKSTGIQDYKAQIAVEKIQQGCVFFWITTEDNKLDDLIQLLKNTNGELIQTI